MIYLSNQTKVTVVDYADVLKASYENEDAVIISYKPSVDGSFDCSEQVYQALSFDSDNPNLDISNYQITDSEGNPIVIEGLHYYTIGENNKLVVLSSDEVKELLVNNTANVPIFMSSNSLDSDSLIASDLDLVSDSMNNLVGYINPQGKMEYSAEIGESGLFGAMYDVTSYYKNINNTLQTSIAEEADAIATIAAGYDVLDRAAAQKAEQTVSSPGYGGYQGGGSSKKPEYTVNGMTAADITASTKSMIAKTKEAALSGNFDAITGFLGETAKAGKIGKISVSKLGETIDKIVPSLEEDAQNCTNMISSINDFMSQIKANGNLRGKAWKTVKKNLKKYKALLETSIDSSEFLANVMEAAKKMIEDFLYPDTEIDDSVLPELEAQFQELKKTIENLTIKLKEMKDSQHEVCNYTTDKNGKPVTDYSSCYTDPSDEDIQKFQKSLDSYQLQADEIEAKIKRINEFAVVVGNAQKLIKDATEEVKKAFENPIQSNNNNGGFSSRFNLDLSAYGIEGSASGEFLKDYLNNLNNGTHETPKNGISGADLLGKGATQKGVRYHSMHYGPKDSKDKGFGCAMFVAYCFNELLHPGENINGGDKNTEGFYGGCSHFFGNITTDNFDYHNKGFVEVDPADRQAGDIVCFVTTRESDDLRGSAKNCFHVAIYTGEGNKIMHSTGFDITNGGVGISTIGDYKRAKSESLNRHHSNGTLDNYDKKTYKGYKDSGIQVIYLRYVGPEGTAVQV